MKSKTLLTLLSVVMCSVAYAQTDITPSRYVFSNQDLGKFTVNAVNAGANPTAGWAVPVDNFNNGFFMLAGGPAVFTALDAAQPAAIQEGINIVDLGGNVGKVLAMRGKTSNLPIGTAMGAAYAGAWFNMNFYFDKLLTPIRENVRVRLVFSIYENTISATGSALSKFYTSNWQNNVSPALADIPATFPSDFFQATDESGDPMGNDDGEAYYDPTKWLVYEFDTQIPEESGNPNRLKIEFLGTAGNMTLFLKELKFIKNPVGEPVVRQLVRFTPGTTALNSIKAGSAKLQVSVAGNNVKLMDVNAGNRVDVYSVAGQLCKTFVSSVNNESFDLQNGFYIVRVASKATKVTIR